jgi:hypothetical protein
MLCKNSLPRFEKKRIIMILHLRRCAMHVVRFCSDGIGHVYEHEEKEFPDDVSLSEISEFALKRLPETNAEYARITVPYGIVCVYPLVYTVDDYPM